MTEDDTSFNKNVPMITELISEALKEIQESPRHELSFRNRKKILLSLGPQIFDDRNSAIELGLGKKRRIALALMAAKQVVGAWREGYGTSLAEDMLPLTEGYLLGKVAHPELRKKVDSFQGILQNDSEENYGAYLAGRAAAGAGWVGVYDELLSTRSGLTEEELEDPEDPDYWDAAFWAAGSAANGMPWQEGFDAQKYLDFWRWYLEIAVPKVLKLY